MLLTGGTVVHQPLTMPAEIIRMAQAESVTGIAGVPPLWNQIVRLLVDRPTELPALRRITNTGGKIPPNILELLPQVFPGVDIYLMYGLTEAFRSTYLPPSKFAAKMGSIGRQIPNAQVFAIKHGEGVAGPGEQGELVHAGPLVSMGYWEKPEVTAQKIRPCPELAHLLGDEPVVWSGDLVRVDQDGDLWFVSRMDEMIKTLASACRRPRSRMRSRKAGLSPTSWPSGSRMPIWARRPCGRDLSAASRRGRAGRALRPGDAALHASAALSFLARRDAADRQRQAGPSRHHFRGQGRIAELTRKALNP